MHFAWKGHPQSDLYCVGQDVKPYSLTYFILVQYLHLLDIVTSH